MKPWRVIIQTSYQEVFSCGAVNCAVDEILDHSRAFQMKDLALIARDIVYLVCSASRGGSNF